MRKSTILVFCVVAVVATLAIRCSVDASELDLVSIHKDIAADYADVEHIAADAFSALPLDLRVIFDVREPDEYAISHIADAIQVDPDISAEAFADRYASMIAGRTAVFYCSVGRRSSILAQRLERVVADHGASGPYNLIGGVFQWHNEKRPLVDSDGETEEIHPYDSFWGRLIDNQKAIRSR